MNPQLISSIVGILTTGLPLMLASANPALLLLAQSITALLPELIAEIEKIKASGEISVEDQAALFAAIDLLRKQDFSGPEYKVEP